MKKIELKPCPFCGNDKPKIRQAFSNKHGTSFYYVECGICGGRSGTTSNGNGRSMRTKAEADERITRKLNELWNTRQEDNLT